MSSPGKVIIEVTKQRLATLAEIERDAILRRLDHYRGNRVATATSLGISRTTLWRRLQEYK